MAIVYITDEIKDPVIEQSILGNNVSVEFDSKASVLIVWNDVVDKKYIDRFINLKSIIRCGIGYDLIDIEYAKLKGIAVSNVPDYCVNEVADSAIGFILNIIRGISAMDAISRIIPTNGGWQQHLIKSLKRTSSQVVGIIGAGRIGSNVMNKLSHFGIKCIYFDPFINDTVVNDLLGERLSTLDEVLSKADIVSIHTPLNEHTKGLVGESFIKKMKLGASLVNTARGKIVKDMEIIYKYLKLNHLSSIGFDVLPEEPPLNSSLIKSWKMRDNDLDGRVLINPHAAFYSQESVIEVREKAAINALRVINGDSQLHVVN